ncbi:MAG: Tetratricopeptide 1 repeat-containing protein [Rhodoferax sp.]|nr:Tetratricopeptide 1 repeat-containing protein [Rhodoferax sp.]
MTRLPSTLIFIVLLVAATLAIYLPGLGYGLIFDDARLTDGTIFGSYGSLMELRPRMLSYGSFVWVKAVFGDEWWKQRLVNVLLHLGVASSLYVLFRDLMQHIQFSDAESHAPADPLTLAPLRVGILLFALNPVAVYAVAYLVQRSIVMATFFVALACVVFVRGLVLRRTFWFALAAVAYAFAVMSKEQAVMAGALAVPLYVFVRRPDRRRIAVVVAVAVVVTGAAAAMLWKTYGAILGVAFDTSSRIYVQQLEAIQPGVSAHIFPLSLLNQGALFFRYGALWFLPNVQWMSVDIRPGFPVTFLAFPQIAGAVGFLVVLLGSAWLLLRRSDVWGFIGLCLLLPCLLFFTEFATVWVQDPFVLYRSYLWAVSVPGLVALPLIGLKPRLVYTIGFVLALLFSGLALERTLSLKDDLTVWSDAIDKVDLQASPSAVGRWRPFINRGAYYLDREMPDYAYNDFARADALGELQGSARFNLGVSEQLMNKHEAAIISFARAEALGFNDSALYYHRGESLYALGRFGEAVASYSVALSKPEAAEVEGNTRFRRAEASIRAQNFDAAIADFEMLRNQKPDDYRVLLALGMAQVGKRNAVVALPIFNRLLSMRASPVAYYGRAMALSMQGDRDASLKDLDQAIRMDPGNASYKALRAQLAAQK